VNGVCDHVLRIVANNQQNADVDLIKDYSEVMLRSAEVDISQTIVSQYFKPSLDLFQTSLENINSSELNKSLI